MDDQRKTQPEGLISGLTGIARNGLGLVISRIELAAIELSEVRGNLLTILMLGAFGALAAWFALAFGALLIVVLAWPAMGWTILALLAVVFAVAAVILFSRLRAIVRGGKLSMPATMAELRNDRETLL